MSEWIPLEDFNSSVLSKNEEDCRNYRPELWARLESIYKTKGIVVRRDEAGIAECAVLESGEPKRLIESVSVRRYLSGLQDSLALLTNPSQPALLFVIHWDLGYSFDWLYQNHLKEAAWKITVIVEPDTRLLAASMALWSWSDVLADKRLFFITGKDWAEQLIRLAGAEHLFALARIEAFSCRSGNDTECLLFRSQVRQVAEKALQQARRVFERELESASVYYERKSPDELRKIMAVDWSGGMAVTYIHRRFLDECSAQGLEVVYHKPSVLGGFSFLRALSHERPDLLVMVNFAPEKHAPLQILDRIRTPRMVWFLDDPQNFVNAGVRFGKNDFLFTWDMSYKTFLQLHDAQSVDHFPYVADLDQAEAKVNERFIAPVSYIGQVGFFNPEEHGLDEAAGKLAQKAGYHKSLEPQRTYSSLVMEYQKEFGLRLIQSENDPLPRSMCYAIYIVGNALRRIRVLERTVPFGLRLYGNEDWLKVLGNCPLRDCYCGPADPMRDVPDIFVSSQINLNIHSLHALNSLNQRDFNCPLVGGFLLTDWVDGADAFFEPDREMAFYYSLDDLEEKIRFYLDRPEAREEIIRRGRERVLSEHVYAKRVPQVLETLKKRIRERYLSK